MRSPRPPPLPADWTRPSDDELAGLIDERIAPRKGQGVVVGVHEPAVDGKRMEP